MTAPSFVKGNLPAQRWISLHIIAANMSASPWIDGVAGVRRWRAGLAAPAVGDATGSGVGRKRLRALR